LMEINGIEDPFAWSREVVNRTSVQWYWFVLLTYS
jgi:hypothetical protein